MTQKVDDKVLEAVQKTAPYCPDMMARWILNSITSGTGEYMPIDIADAKFTFTSNEKMDFGGTLRVLLAPDYEEAGTVSFKWQKRGAKLTREFQLV